MLIVGKPRLNTVNCFIAVVGQQISAPEEEIVEEEEQGEVNVQNSGSGKLSSVLHFVWNRKDVVIISL